MTPTPSEGEQITLYRHLVAHALAIGAYNPRRRARAAADVTTHATATVLDLDVNDVLRSLRTWRTVQLGAWTSPVPEGSYALDGHTALFEVRRPHYGPDAGLIAVYRRDRRGRRSQRCPAPLAARLLADVEEDLLGAARRYVAVSGRCWRCERTYGPEHAGCVPRPLSVGI